MQTSNLRNSNAVHIRSFYAHGKLLLTGEYFVLDGAQALALPTRLGQSLNVEYEDSPSDNPVLQWDAFNSENKIWMSAAFTLKDFSIISKNGNPENLQKILRQARKLNCGFISGSNNIHAKTYLDFPGDWGLGSSSTLIHMIAELADICPFTLLEQTLGGSGYDIACAGSDSPILYSRQNNIPAWDPVSFSPPFKDDLYFVHLNKKQNTQHGIAHYKSKSLDKVKIIDTLNGITSSILSAQNLETFEGCLNDHEKILSEALDLQRVKDMLFSDYWGSVKSLGAWGGDFVLATSNRSSDETLSYFQKRGYNTVLPYKDLIL